MDKIDVAREMDIESRGIEKHRLLEQVIVVVRDVPHAYRNVLPQLVGVFASLKIREILYDYRKT